MVDKLYHIANPRSRFRPITSFIVEIQCFVCDRAISPIVKKLQSKVWRVDSVKSTFSFGGYFTEERAVSIGVGDFQLEDTNVSRGAVCFSCIIGAFDLEEGL